MEVEFENAALFLQVGLPYTLTFHENGAFRKRFSNWRTLKTPVFCFCVNGKHFNNSVGVTIITDRIFLKHKCKMTADCCVFKFLRRRVDGKLLMHFQRETSVFKFLGEFRRDHKVNLSVLLRQLKCKLIHPSQESTSH